MAKTISVNELLKNDPTNWGRWGPDDEVGALNFLTAGEVLRGCRAVKQGKTFTLQLPMCDPAGDPITPGRTQPQHFMVMDKGRFIAGKAEPFDGGLEYADDALFTFLHGTTQYDALGHVWAGDHIWNGYDAKTTIGGLQKASILPIAQRGVVGHGVLLDLARAQGKKRLEDGAIFTHRDLISCAEQQGSEIQPRDILVIRTGWFGQFYETDAETSIRDYTPAELVAREPGLTYTSELMAWFHEMEIPNILTDTFANETAIEPNTGVAQPLHVGLMSRLGVAFAEMGSLDELAEDCASDGQYDFLYAAAPLKVFGGSGAPVNPIAIK